MSAADDEFADFMRGRWAAMVRLAYALTGDGNLAQDVAQAAFTRALAAWPLVRRARDPDAYLRRIVLNENRKRFRGQRVREDLPGDLPDTPAAASPGPEDRDALLAALSTLGPRQRAVLVLRYYLDLSEAETAAALGCSVGTVKSQASRALAALRQHEGLRDGTGPAAGGPRPAMDTVAPPVTAFADATEADTIEGGWR